MSAKASSASPPARAPHLPPPASWRAARPMCARTDPPWGRRATFASLGAALWGTLVAGPAGAVLAPQAPPPASPFVQAITSSFQVTATAQGDLDGDGLADEVICYRPRSPTPDERGGLLVLRATPAGLENAYHAAFEGPGCEGIAVGVGSMELSFPAHEPGLAARRVVWTRGKHFGFRGEAGHPLRGARAQASSVLEVDPRYAAASALDGRLDSAWVEGAQGTGLGETWRVAFEGPLHIARVGLFASRGDEAQSAYPHNRLHRGSLAATLHHDARDSDSASAGAPGDRYAFTLQNRASLQYLAYARNRVTALELRIEGVFLGKRDNHTYMAEVDIVPLVDLQGSPRRARADDARGGVAPAALQTNPPPVPPPPVPSPIVAGDNVRLSPSEVQRRQLDETLRRLDEEAEGFTPDAF